MSLSKKFKETIQQIEEAENKVNEASSEIVRAKKTVSDMWEACDDVDIADLTFEDLGIGKLNWETDNLAIEQMMKSVIRAAKQYSPIKVEQILDRFLCKPKP